MRKKWSIIVNWGTSNEKYVNLLLRSSTEHYRRTYHLTWIVDENRFANNKIHSNTPKKFVSATEIARATASEVALAKRMLADRATAN